MSHRLDEKQARREARLAAEAQQRRIDRRHQLIRRAGYGAVAAIAAVLITLAVVLGGNGGTAANPMGAAHSGTGAPGDKAPSFALTDVVSGRTITNASLAGKKTMLFFSEGVSCQACLVQAADLEKAATLKKAGIQLISVTTDPANQLAQAAKQYRIKTPMLADPTGTMSRAYGMLGHGGMGHPTQDGHAFILIGTNGEILWHKAYQEMYVQPAQLLSDLSAETKA